MLCLSQQEDRHLHDEGFRNMEYSGDCFWLVAKLLGLDVKHDFKQIYENRTIFILILLIDKHLNKAHN